MSFCGDTLLFEVIVLFLPCGTGGRLFKKRFRKTLSKSRQEDESDIPPDPTVSRESFVETFLILRFVPMLCMVEVLESGPHGTRWGEPREPGPLESE